MRTIILRPRTRRFLAALAIVGVIVCVLFATAPPPPETSEGQSEELIGSPEQIAELRREQHEQLQNFRQEQLRLQQQQHVQLQEHLPPVVPERGAHPPPRLRQNDMQLPELLPQPPALGPRHQPAFDEQAQHDSQARDLQQAQAQVAQEQPSPRIHAFYYAWYGAPEYDSVYLHWNHNVINGNHKYTPPEQIGANFYPQLGPYSSINPAVVDLHMRQMKEAGIAVLSLSWYPPGLADDQGIFNKAHNDLVLETAAKYGLQVCLHIEPFKNRDGPSTRAAWIEFLDLYGGHPGLFRDATRGNLPWIYVYDSYQTPSASWKRVFGRTGDLTVRGTKYDVVAIGLLVNQNDKQDLLSGGFDGAYSYFATDGFTYGSTTRQWADIARWASSNRFIWVPSVGPGYSDLRIRPWNPANQRGRGDGKYYEDMWKAALSVKPEVVSITSFNEWHEGTQIEPAVKFSTTTDPPFSYEYYPNDDPMFYLRQTKYWVDEFLKQSG
ncbi:mannosidase [Capsaspora owczarzaki ATCC 30864]|uniref:Mannosidase n=2 Tax=Capsaspora owczarzaki (strain ATCC 30864) TaxID=595528 RepID=A0A0D2UFD6_CAPO3|nr:mannosidase [Capsaspora owczarzaki ATCC 30864]